MARKCAFSETFTPHRVGHGDRKEWGSISTGKGTRPSPDALTLPYHSCPNCIRYMRFAGWLVLSCPRETRELCDRREVETPEHGGHNTGRNSCLDETPQSEAPDQPSFALLDPSPEPWEAALSSSALARLGLPGQSSSTHGCGQLQSVDHQAKSRRLDISRGPQSAEGVNSSNVVVRAKRSL
jgi:hypothetical protein